MHLHLVRAKERPVPQRPAKVVQLDVRRQAHREKARAEQQPRLRPVA
jgi:hypothetical protein